MKNKNNFNISSYKALGECYDPVLSYLFAREDHIVTEIAKNTKEIVMVSKHLVTYLFSLFKKTHQKNYTKCTDMIPDFRRQPYFGVLKLSF